MYETRRNTKIRIYVILATSIVFWACLIIFNIVKSMNQSTGVNKYDAEISLKANEYVEKNEIIIPVGTEKYLSFAEINYSFSNDKCSNAGGVSIYNGSGELEYTPFYVCGKENSEVINAYLKGNNSNDIKLKGDNPTILKPGEEYVEEGYELLNNVTVKVEKDINRAAGIYYVNYIVSTEYDSYTVTRVIVREEVSGETTATNDNVSAIYPTIELHGDIAKNLLVGDAYVEEGYTATDAKDGDITKDVQIIGNLNTKIKGTYTLTYRITNSRGKTTTQTRIIIVNDVNLKMLKLKGSVKMSITEGVEYIDPGYTAIFNNKDISEKVKLNGEVDSSVPGTYTIIYTVTNNLGQTDSAVRTVIVNKKTSSGSSGGNADPGTSILNTSKSPTEVTSGKVVISIKGNYEYVILPNGSKSENQDTSYEVSSNGNYKFTAYYKDGKNRTSTVSVTNINTTVPTGSCLLDGNTITVTIRSAGQHTYAYSINSVNYTEYLSSATYTTSSPATSAHVKIKNNVGTVNTITCATSNIVMPVKEVPNKYKDNSIMKASSETFKVNLVKAGSYYMTFMWMKDANKQHVMANVKDVGTGSISKMIGNVTSKNFMGIKNKIAIVTNSDYASNAWGFGCNKGTNLSPIALIINNGKVIKKNTSSDCDKKSKNGHISPQVAYIDKNGTLHSFENLASYTKAERSAIFDEIINSGVYNTFEVLRGHPIIDNGAVRLVTSEKTESALRVALCQIDSNNYIQFVTTRGVKVMDVANKMQELGCINGVNLDGGGSTSFGYKKASQSSFTKVIYSSRPNWAISIFTEL